MKCIITAVLILATISVAATRVYEVEPYRNYNGKVHGAVGIGQTFVATCDSFLWVDLFMGSPGRPGQFYFEILTWLENVRVYEGWQDVPSKGWQYVRCTTLIKREPIIKGKTYLLKVTHSNGDSINFYYDPRNTYQYGHIVVSGLVEPGLKDLSARIEGINKVESKAVVSC